MKRIVLLTFGLVLVLGLSGCWDMASQTKSGSVAVSIAGPGDPWSDPEHALAHDADYAHAHVWMGSDSEYLCVTGFGFMIPVDATVAGVVAQFEKCADASAVIDGAVRLVIAGVPGATDRSIPVGDWPYPGNWPLVDTYVSHGSTTDLWGETLTPAIVNSADFGVAIRARYFGIGAAAYINHVQMTVYYDSNRLRRRALMDLTRTRPIAVQEIWP